MHASRRRHPTQDEGRPFEAPGLRGGSEKFAMFFALDSSWLAQVSWAIIACVSMGWMCREKLSASNRLKSKLPVQVPSRTDMEFTFRYWPVLPPVGGHRECDLRPSWASGACGRALQSSPPPGKCQIMACASGMALRKRRCGLHAEEVGGRSNARRHSGGGWSRRKRRRRFDSRASARLMSQFESLLPTLCGSSAHSSRRAVDAPIRLTASSLRWALSAIAVCFPHL
jgi:hypothetical protein